MYLSPGDRGWWFKPAETDRRRGANRNARRSLDRRATSRFAAERRNGVVLRGKECTLPEEGDSLLRCLVVEEEHPVAAGNDGVVALAGEVRATQRDDVIVRRGNDASLELGWWWQPVDETPRCVGEVAQRRAKRVQPTRERTRDPRSRIRRTKHHQPASARESHPIDRRPPWRLSRL